MFVCALPPSYHFDIFWHEAQHKFFHSHIEQNKPYPCDKCMWRMKTFVYLWIFSAFPSFSSSTFFLSLIFLHHYTKVLFMIPSTSPIFRALQQCILIDDQFPAVLTFRAIFNPPVSNPTHSPFFLSVSLSPCSLHPSQTCTLWIRRLPTFHLSRNPPLSTCPTKPSTSHSCTKATDKLGRPTLWAPRELRSICPTWMGRQVVPARCVFRHVFMGKKVCDFRDQAEMKVESRRFELILIEDNYTSVQSVLFCKTYL